jgi:hypothetical protein
LKQLIFFMVTLLDSAQFSEAPQGLWRHAFLPPVKPNRVGHLRQLTPNHHPVTTPILKGLLSWSDLKGQGE